MSSATTTALSNPNARPNQAAQVLAAFPIIAVAVSVAVLVVRRCRRRRNSEYEVVDGGPCKFDLESGTSFVEAGPDAGALQSEPPFPGTVQTWVVYLRAFSVGSPIEVRKTCLYFDSSGRIASLSSTWNGTFSWRTRRVSLTYHVGRQTRMRFRGRRERTGFAGAWFAEGDGTPSSSSGVFYMSVEGTEWNCIPLQFRNPAVPPMITYRVTDDATCGICCETPCTSAYVPCGHVFACEHCSTRVHACPVCRSAICHTFHL